MNKKQLYESMMENIANELKSILNEDEKELTPGEKMDAWHNGERKENIKACGADKLRKYKAICQAKGYDAEVAAIDAEIEKRGLKESAIFENEEPDIREKYGDEFADLVGDVDDGVRVIDPDKDSEIIFDALVPGSGSADTLGGEIMRAAMRIAYRWWNDGDCAGQGYGRETVNPAVRFLDFKVKKVAFSPNSGKQDSGLRKIVDKLIKFVDRAYCDITDDEYEKLTKDLLIEAVRYIIENRLWNRPNYDDMWDYKNKDLDVDRDDDWEDEGW